MAMYTSTYNNTIKHLLSGLAALLLTITTSTSYAQEPADSSKSDTEVPLLFQWNVGGTISPQLLFLGSFDVGAFTNVELVPLSSKPQWKLMGGIDLRNKWFSIPSSSPGLSTTDLKTSYAITAMGNIGAGYSFRSKKKPESNTFYFSMHPTFFTFKESVVNEYINNTAAESNVLYHQGITWSNTKITKKGKVLNTQFYIPILSTTRFDDLRFMNLKLGLVF